MADGNIKNSVEGLLSRPRALGIREVDHYVLPHPERDPGCLLRAPDFLRSFRQRFEHALVILDREGSGREEATREQLEADLEERLAINWNERAAAVMPDPELEVWVWSDSPHVPAILGWAGRSPDLRAWLVEKGLWGGDESKPWRPKEAVEKVLRAARKPRSSALYRQLAEKVSVRRCKDPAFRKLLETLQGWFPQNNL